MDLILARACRRRMSCGAPRGDPLTCAPTATSDGANVINPRHLLETRGSALARILAGLALLIAGVAIGWSVPRFLHPSEQAEEPEKKKEEHGDGAEPVKVEAEVATSGSLVTTTVAIGRVLAENAAMIGLASRAGG